MGLFDFLKLKPSAEPVDQLALLGADESRTNEFIELLARSNIWILGQVDELTNINPDKQAMRKNIEEGARGMAEVKTQADIKVHTFKIDDQDEYLVIPFFTSPECIQNYINSIRIEKVTGFPCFQCSPSILLRDDMLRLPGVMNPQSLNRYFGAEEKIALAKHLTANSQP